MNSNQSNTTINVIANRTNLSQSLSIINNVVGGQVLTLNAASSSFDFQQNIGSILALNSVAYSPLAVATAGNSIYIATNQFAGFGNHISASGVYDTNDAQGLSFQRAVEANIIGGINNRIDLSLAPTGSNSLSATAIVGLSLIITGSSKQWGIDGIGANAGGSAFFGRWNAQDGNRAQSGQTIFAVGTGNSTTRKTGFLIDSGSNTYVEGTLNVSGSTSLTGSLTIQSGSSFFANGNKQFNVGAFQSNVTQSGSANVSQSMNFETTDISSGISIVSNSRITLANSGTYNIQFSAQLNADTGADTIWIWLKKNGTNVSSTATKLVLANNEANIAAWNFVVDSAASDYFELAWQNANGHAKLLTEPAAGNYPAIPSIILTVTQVR